MQLAEDDGCFGSILFGNEKPVSYQYMTKKNKRLIGKFIGFDPDYQKYSPGKIHMFSCIQHLFDEPSYEIYDFAGGGFRYMIDFSSDRASCADMLKLSLHPWHLTIIGTHMALASLTKASTTCCDLLGLREHLRKKLRGR
jgi:CelD/BcsL family acetyltransferase involved in cellulose biosynthesis